MTERPCASALLEISDDLTMMLRGALSRRIVLDAAMRLRSIAKLVAEIENAQAVLDREVGEQYRRIGA